MKGVLVFLFLIFFTIGQINGYQARRKPDHLKQAALSNLELWGDDQGSELRYQCGNKTVFKYDIDTNQLLEDADQIKKNEESRADQDSSSISLNEVRTVLGGTGGGWTAKDAVETVTKGKSKKKLALEVLAGVSGISIGEWAAAVWEPSCDELSGTTVLEDPATWKQLERSKYIRYREGVRRSDAIAVLEDTLANDGQLSEDEKREINVALKAFSDGDLIDSEHDFKSEDFTQLYKVEDLGEKYRAAYVMRAQTPSVGPRH